MRSLVLMTLFLVIVNQAKSHSSKNYSFRHLMVEDSNNCSKVFKFDSTDILAGPGRLDFIGVKDISYSIGYSVLNAVKSEQAQEGPDDACKIRLAQILNKFGVPIAASAEGAQAAIRGTNFNDLAIQSCPGFGKQTCSTRSCGFLKIDCLFAQACVPTFGMDRTKMCTPYLH